MCLEKLAIHCAKVYVRGVVLTFNSYIIIGAYMTYKYDYNKNLEKKYITDKIIDTIIPATLVSVLWPVSYPFVAILSEDKGKYIFGVYLTLILLP